MADPKADLKAELAEVERRYGSRLTLGLSALAGGLAVALLVACIGGGLYIGQLQNTIDEQTDKIQDTESDKTTGNTYHIKYEGSKSTEEDDVTVDTARDVEMFIKKDDEGDITSISVADFKRGMLAMYIPQNDECYIASGIQSWMANTSASIAEYEKNNGQTVRVDDDDDEEEDSTMNFEKASDTPVTDHSILPRDIRPFCLAKPLYWIHQTKDVKETDLQENGQDGTRHKRGLYCWWRRCYYYFSYFGWRRYCYYYYAWCYGK